MENGRKGGLVTSSRLTPEEIHSRAVKGGQTLQELYSNDYFRHINSQRKQKKGWPPGKLRKALPQTQEKLQRELESGSLSETTGLIFQRMLNTVTT